MCISTTGTPSSAAASSAPGWRRACTSLIMPAPAATAARITSGLKVSTLNGSAVCAASRSITGITRRSSSSTGTGVAPGRVDSPPMSSTSAPSPARRRPCATAASTLAWAPPSENESGVTLTMPITRGRSSSSRWAPHCRLGEVSNIGESPGSGRGRRRNRAAQRHAASATHAWRQRRARRFRRTPHRRGGQRSAIVAHAHAGGESTSDDATGPAPPPTKKPGIAPWLFDA
ncbi:hypothetical protein NB705_003123 [Xanthomonas sacchari]|nr:hypothetical protein [Xanthomonas sacchari]